MNKLVLEMVADSNGLIRGLQQAQKAVHQFVQSAGGAGSAIGGPLNQALSAFTNLAKGGGLAAGVLAGALISTSTAAVVMTLAAGRQAEQIEQLSSITDLSTDTLQDYQAILGRVGLGGDDLVRMFKTLSTKMEEARAGAGPASDRFRQIGIDLRTVTSTEDLIKKVSSSLAGFHNGVEKAAIQTDLLGKSGLKFGLALEEMAKGANAANRESINLGATLSGGQLAELSAMDDRVDDLGTAWTRFGQQLGSFVAPAVDFAAKALTNLLAMASDGLRAMNALSGISGASDSRPQAPALVDQSKVLERARASADAHIKLLESQDKQEDALRQANFQRFQAHQSAWAGFSVASDLEMARDHEAVLKQNEQVALASTNAQILNLEAFVAKKSALFTKDEKGQADLAKFTIESQQKIAEAVNQGTIAAINSGSARLAAARKTADLMRELEIQPYQDAVVAAKTLDEAQQALFQSEAGLLGASEAARRVRFNLIAEEAALTRAMIDQTITEETRKAQALQNLDLQTDTKRRQAVQAFPTFFESQMQAIVASNAFSMGSMVSTWTGGIAQMVIHGGNLQAVWEQTQVALVQAALNAGVQLAAQWALRASVELGILTATESAKFGLKTASNAALMAAETAKNVTLVAENEAKNAAIVAGDAAAAGGTVSIWAAAGSAIGGILTTMMTTVGTFLMETVIPALVSMGEAIAEFLFGVGAAEEATIFGIPAGIATMIAAGVILAAVGSLAAFAFADGGIATGPTRALIGEAGSPEAVIPLNSRGASFFRDAMGGGGGSQPIIVKTYLNGREIARAVSDELPGALRTMGAY